METHSLSPASLGGQQQAEAEGSTEQLTLNPQNYCSPSVPGL